MIRQVSEWLHAFFLSFNMKQIRLTLILLFIIVASSSYAKKYTDVKIGKINYTIWYETSDKKDYAEVTSPEKDITVGKSPSLRKLHIRTRFIL